MIRNNRIDALVEQTKGINTLLDIGCDHGLVLKKALDENYIKVGIAADINKKPLASAKANLANYPVSYILSDGFEAVNMKYDGVVIAGVGATLITKILDKAPAVDITYILQANGKYDILRYYLMNNNYKIIDETIVYEKHYYVILKVVRGNMQLSNKEIYLGPILKTKHSSISYYKHLLKKYNPLVDRATDNRNAILEKINWLKQMIRTDT